MASVEPLAELSGEPHANVFPGSEPTTIRLRLDAGERVEPHDHPDRHVVVYLIEGEIEMHLGSETYDLDAGDAVRFDGDQAISPVATADSTALVLLAEKTE
ncbi:cupin domain-containing protein [Halopenitus salinus]|jgi:quercetin dioxygenase-like cupin family protein|uniref:Cupin domain-containing protein n=1 Tax=Halopenitus salinus TaxID=1198295 RepID=A0ABD5V3C2_9EURY